MRTIERSNVFKKDYKRVKAMPRYNKKIDSLLTGVVSLLREDKELPDNNFDQGYRFS